MQDKELYEKLLGLKAPWQVSDVDLRMEESKVTVRLEHEPLARFPCPECGFGCPTHDHRRRQWRHLDTCGIVTLIEADVPRVDCQVHGVRQAKVPWAEPGSGFTAMFEALAISWLKVAPASAVSERMMISWDEAWGIMERAVRRGMARREAAEIQELAIDETSFQKRHEYVTVLVNRQTGIVIDILDDRKKATLKKWLQANKDQLHGVRSISMDMWEPFITAVQESIEGADDKMVRTYLWGILNAIMLKVTNAIAESINATIQKIKARACGFRNRARFRIAILFHKGGLSMLPLGAWGT